MIYKTALFLLFITAAHSATIHHLDEFKTIETSISSQGLTRIAIKGDRISNVFGATGYYVLEADEEQGQIFIRPADGNSFSLGGVKPKPIHLTLTTEGGHTQDLCLLPQDKAPDAIILKTNEDIKHEVLKEKNNRAPIMREEVEDLIRASREGRIPLGYKSMPLDLQTLQGPYLLVKELKGEKLRCLTYEVKNQSSGSLILSEEAFSKTNAWRQSSKYPAYFSGSASSESPVAILISNKTLNPGEGANVYVVIRTLH